MDLSESSMIDVVPSGVAHGLRFSKYALYVPLLSDRDEGQM